MNTLSSTLCILALLLLSAIDSSSVILSSCADWVFEACIGQEETVECKTDKDKKTNGILVSSIYCFMFAFKI